MSIYLSKLEFVYLFQIDLLLIGKGGKNRRRGKNENENEKRELVFKEDGQGNHYVCYINLSSNFNFKSVVFG